MRHKSLCGSALISALFIMTLIAIAATAMSTRVQFDIYRTQLMIKTDKLTLASEAVTFWAMDQLMSTQKPFMNSDSTGKLLDLPPSLTHVYPQVTLQGALYDAQSRFNLNNLQDKSYQPLLLKLLEHTFPNLKASDHLAIIKAVVQWITPYQPAEGQNAFLSYYLSQKPPYLPGYQLLTSASEFRLMKGVNASIAKRLLPLVIALPTITPININTSPKALLMTLGNGLNDSQTDELIEARGKKGIHELTKLTELLEKLNIPAQQVTINSEYYVCVATVTSEELTMTRYTVLKRTQDRNKRWTVSMVFNGFNTG